MSLENGSKRWRTKPLKGVFCGVHIPSSSSPLLVLAVQVEPVGIKSRADHRHRNSCLQNNTTVLGINTRERSGKFYGKLSVGNIFVVFERENL